MTPVLFSVLIFLALIQWIIFIDVILSWGALIGIRFRPRFIQGITLPIYGAIRSVMPSSFGNIDFAPIVAFIAIEIVTKAILTWDPSILDLLSR